MPVLSFMPSRQLQPPGGAPMSPPPSAPTSSPPSPKAASARVPSPKAASTRVPVSSTRRPTPLVTDYLVIGAGLHSLAFVDELLVQDDAATFVIVDDQPAPGGHWNDAYEFVSLHQAAAAFGVNSEPLAAEDEHGFEPIDIANLASKDRLLAYFSKVMYKLEASGRVRYFPGASYRWEDRTFVDATGHEHAVAYRKIVTPTSNVRVPSQRPPPFDIAPGVDTRPVNALSSEAERGAISRDAYRRYVVVGGGKTGTDAVLFLRKHGVPLGAITWVVPQPMWYMLRDAFDGPSKLLDAFDTQFTAALAEPDAQSVFLALERAAAVGRIDASSPPPTVFRGATILRKELAELRALHAAGRIVDLGRVTSIDAGGLTLRRGRIEMPLVAEGAAAAPLVVDCTASATAGYSASAVANPFDGDRIHLMSSFFFNISLSGAALAWMEAHVQPTVLADADTRKNESFYGTAPGHINWDPSTLLYAMYMECKMGSTIMNEPGGASWLSSSRTSWVSSRHVPVPLLLWSMFGPSQTKSKMDAFVAKMEANGFADTPFPAAWREKLAAEKRRAQQRIQEQRRALFAPIAQCLTSTQRCMPAQQHAQPQDPQSDVRYSVEYMVRYMMAGPAARVRSL